MISSGVKCGRLYECSPGSRTYFLVRATEDCACSKAGLWRGKVIDSSTQKSEIGTICFFSFNDWWREVDENKIPINIYDELEKILFD